MVSGNDWTLGRNSSTNARKAGSCDARNWALGVSDALCDRGDGCERRNENGALALWSVVEVLEGGDDSWSKGSLVVDGVDAPRSERNWVSRAAFCACSAWSAIFRRWDSRSWRRCAEMDSNVGADGVGGMARFWAVDQ